MTDSQVGRLGLYFGVLSTGFSLWSILHRLLEPPPASRGLSDWPRTQTILFIGTIAGAFYGILWALAQKAFSWKFGEGEGSLPDGWPSVVLSTCLVLPLVLVPSLYQRLTHLPVVSSGHSIAGIVAILLSAIGHLFLYGSKAINFPGMRNIILPIGSPANWVQAMKMELVYALTHFSTVVLIYRVALNAQLDASRVPILFPVIITTLFWLSAVCISISLKYPESLVDKGWMQVRGVVHGFLLAVSLEAGMLM